MANKTKPFLTWVGGKSLLAKHIIPRLPSDFKAYHEPFVGGGAVFFSLEPCQQIDAVLSDVNPELINCYTVVRDHPTKLIHSLEMLEYSRDTHDERFFRQVQGEYNPANKVQSAARFIFVTKHCFRGKDPSNRKNLSQLLGKAYFKEFFSRNNILKCSSALQGTLIGRNSYKEILPIKDHFYYLDPPYYDVSRDLYRDDMTSIDEHIELRDYCIEIDKAGAKFMLSNSCNKVTLDLYKDFNIIKLKTKYPTRNMDKDYKGTYEILVRNY